MDLKRNDISQIIERVKKENEPAVSRGRSFDYCYNYFRTNTGVQLTKDIEKSCLAIGFYLASWGMFRSRGFIWTKSVKCFEPLIEFISKSKTDSAIWDLDLDNYNPENIQKICNLYDEIYDVLKMKIFNNELSEQLPSHTVHSPSKTLVTKIMLGVFGSVPAFDTNFNKFLEDLSNGKRGLNSFNAETLDFISQFYCANETVINNLSDSTQTIDFKNGKLTGLRYTKARIIDMYGFIIGERILKKESERKKYET